VKLTAPCWTRCIYRYPPLANQIWINWRASLPENIKASTPINIPRGWNKYPHIANYIIKACPFCKTNNSTSIKRIGNLEHLQLYCTAPILLGTRTHCHQKIEVAIYALYNYASFREYKVLLGDCHHKTTPQENLENTAVEVEKTQRYVVNNSQLILEARTNNKAILQENSITIAVLLNRLPAEKPQDYNNYPLSYKLGFIHSIPEEDFDMVTATITDVGFMGMFPKQLLHILAKCVNDIKKSNQDNDEFISLIDNLVTAFIYRPIMMQKVIQILVTRRKNLLYPTEQEGSIQSTKHKNRELLRSIPMDQSTLSVIEDVQNTPHIRETCHADKCRLLKAKGGLRRPTFCSNKRNMCSGCINKSLRHRKVDQLE